MFNVEDYISNAFNSIVNQTFNFEELEIIFIDDNSTDNSLEIIEDYSKKYKNVISIHLNENSGSAGKPRNIGMSYATADYLMFLDPDDLLTENACELLYNEITKESLDIVTGVHTTDGVNVHERLLVNTLTNPNEDMEIRVKQVNKIINDSDFYLKLNTLDDYPSFIANSNIWTKIFKKTLIEDNDIRFPEKIPAQDSVFLLNALLNAKGIKLINQITYKYEINREDSISHNITKENLINRLDAYYEMYYLCAEKNKTQLFKQYLLFDKLNYFLATQLLKSNLPITELLDVLEYANPLFKLYIDYNKNVKSNLSKLFDWISSKKYDYVIEKIYEDNAPKQEELLIATIFNDETMDLALQYNLIDLTDNIISKIDNNFNLFLYVYEKEQILKPTFVSKLEDLLRYFHEKSIPTVIICPANMEVISKYLKFDYILNSKNKLKNALKNINK